MHQVRDSDPGPRLGVRTGGVVVARAGFEPATFHFSGERCYQLSYLAKTETSR